MKVLVNTRCVPDDRKTLSVVRSLGRRGADVFVAGEGFRGQAFRSRHVRGRYRLPASTEDARAYWEALERLLATERFDVVIPTYVETTEPLSCHRGSLEQTVGLAVPEENSLRTAMDKWLTLRLAEELGIRTPRTRCPGTSEELDRAAAELAYPVVVKPREGTGAIGLWYADSARALLDGWHAGEEPAAFGRTLIQECAEGPIHDACLLCRHGEPRACLTQKRLITYPATGGIGVLNETTREPDLMEAASALLRKLGWHGPAQVEFKRNPSTGEPVLMEINGRLWGTLDLAVQAGIDFPWLLYEMAVRGDIAIQTEYTVGLRYRWPLPYGFLHAYETRRVAESLRVFFGPARSTRSDLCWDDPLPAVAEGLWTLRRMWLRRSMMPERAKQTRIRRAVRPA